MDLGSSLEKQQDHVPLQKEEHELPTLPERKRSRNIVGSTVNLLLVTLGFLIICGGLTTLTVFLITGHAVNKGASSRCILFASYDTKNSQPFQFGDKGICEYVVWSMVAISAVGALYVFGYCGRVCCSLCWGLSTFNLFAVLDVIFYAFMTLTSISVAVIVRLGHEETCDAVHKTYPEQFSSNITNCSSSAIVNAHKDEVNFSSKLYTTEMSAWATSVALLCVTLVHSVLLIGYLLKCCVSRKTRSQLSGNNDGESPFRQAHLPDENDDDEALLDPSSDDWRSSSTNNDHTSFPPYNLGYPEQDTSNY